MDLKKLLILSVIVLISTLFILTNCELVGNPEIVKTTWEQLLKLFASDAQSGDFFGNAVAISGDYAIVGAPYEDGGQGDPMSGAGAAYIY